MKLGNRILTAVFFQLLGIMSIMANDVEESTTVAGFVEKMGSAVENTLNTAVIKMSTDSIEDEKIVVDEVVANDTVGITDSGESLSLSLQQEKLEYEHQAHIVAIGVIVPCFTIVVILIGVLIYLFCRQKSRNKLIEQAILNNYQLPESFYTGTSSNKIIYNNIPEKANSLEEDMSSQSNFSSNNVESKLPPTPFERREFTQAISMSAIGLLILFFFINIDVAFIGIIAGGIPLILGLSKVVTYLYFNQRR